MDFDYRKGSSGRGHMGVPYDASRPMYGAPYDRPYAPAPATSSSYYPTVGQSVGPPFNKPPPPVPVSSSSGTGIRVAIKPEYRITPPPQLSPQLGELPRSTFQFDFEFERKILAEAEKGSQNWSRIALENPARQKKEESSPLGNLLPDGLYSRSTGAQLHCCLEPRKFCFGGLKGSADDQIINKYVAMGLNREAVSMAVTSFGDDQNKVREFVTSYSLLREMGFPSHTVAGVLAMYDNDRDKALAHFLNNPT